MGIRALGAAPAVQVTPMTSSDVTRARVYSGKCADEYYKALTNWSVRDRTVQAAGECLRLGLAYLGSLDDLLSLLRLRTEDYDTNMIERTVEFRSLVEKDFSRIQEFVKRRA